MTIKFISGLALLVASLFLAAADAHAGMARFPYWCEDLGLACTGNSGVFAKFSELDARTFLPPELAQFVEQCQLARSSNNPAALHNAKLDNPLHADPRHPAAVELRMISKVELKQAALPATGARLVADCTGRHIQARETLSAAELKNIFQQIYLLQLTDGFSHLLGNKFNAGSCGADGGSVKVYAYSGTLGAGKPLKPSQFMVDSWEFYPGGAQKGELADIPHAYVDPRCFAGKASSPKPAAAQAETGSKLLVSQFSLAVNDLAVLKAECENSCGQGNVLDGYEPPPGTAHDSCLKCRDSYWSARRKFESGLSRTDFVALMSELEHKSTNVPQQAFFLSAGWRADKKIKSEAEAQQVINWCMENACECSYRIEPNLEALFSDDSIGSPALRAKFAAMESKAEKVQGRNAKTSYDCADVGADDAKWPRPQIFDAVKKPRDN